ncbi:methyltransferase domain-containing protein [Polymorphobacter sp. PAMC 29334]|uniref:RsmB/NOP family class I SAM-dependent RNA methyltransferase n=1 Tax=Polymorphobacter sp. PAMC 29334 TaxID=2862331 RepID=UPI001C769BFC|nr:transcription antitermination factor NusB [Polymorphobacter sp. PAMC 29334]QYE35586.1 methyltransferase domain-containing protein [Polymorphobacter sp. PAMC 29334]
MKHDPDPPGTASRRAALRLLTSVLAQGKPLDGSIANAFHGVERPDDRALARSLASGVLRWLTDLDALIDSATPKPLPSDARARMALRIGLAGRLLLDTPPHAVVSTTLALTEGGPRRLTHAVLSRLLRENAALPEVPALPEPYGERWTAAWGADVAAAAARAFATEPPIDLTLRDTKETAYWAETLGGVSLAPGHVRLIRPGSIPDLPGFEDGAWWVQDLAASLPARLLRPASGTPTLDLCAAPGGKTLQLAAMGADVTALDSSEARLDRVRENLARTRLDARIVTVDALVWAPPAPFDAILLDAPCSASGVFRRHPDVLYLKGARDLAPLLTIQAALLDRAVDWLAPGGTLVFSTCSLEAAEGEAQVDALLRRTRGVVLDPIAADELPDGIAPDARGQVRLLPGTLADAGGADGFFIARLRKEK